jgi:hypothetical protein
VKLVDWSNGVLPQGAGLEPLVPTSEQMPTLRVPLRDSPENARGYREVGIEYSCVPDVAYPWDPEMVKAIREFMPDVAPMWVQWVFLRPNSKEKVVFGRHALGRAIKEPGRDLLPFRCAMPSFPCRGLTFEKPNRIWFIHEGDRDRDYPDIPGTFLPFNDSIVHRARESCRYLKLSEKEYREQMEKDLILDVKEVWDRRKAAGLAEREARDKDFQKYAQKLLDSISDVEMAEYQRGVGKRSRRKKAMVFHGADYPR